MSHHELIHWWRYYCENPFGYRRNDLREALNCAVVAAPHSKKSLPLTSFLLVIPLVALNRSPFTHSPVSVFALCRLMY
jgi:hypothetical protein